MNLNNCLRKKVNWGKERLLELKYYTFFNHSKNIRPLYIAMVDGRFSHGGLSDRLKGIISLYAYCKARHKDFRINFTSPFNLSDYLVPNKYDWRISPEEITCSYWNVRVLNITCEYKGERLLKLKTKKQIHYYNNHNIIESINKCYGTHYSYGELFNELFVPVPELSNLIDIHRKRIGSDYLAAVFRFQDLLGDFKEYDFPTLAMDERLLLMERCKNAILRLMDKHPGQKCLVTSDSSSFLEYISKVDRVYTLPGKVVHMDVTSDASYAIYMKSFLDLYMIAGAKQVFCIGTKEMYPSEFPMYAAKINDIPFERILI